MSDSNSPVILIVEDDEQLSKALQTKFDKDNFVPLVARDGEEGLSLALQKHPDIILLDVIMPKMNGMELMSKLREDSWGKTVPVIILTNVSPDSNSQLNELISTQPSYYLIKSNTKITEILQKVNELLNKKD